MKSKLISHEMPLALMDKHHSTVNDYMYVLLHKMIEDNEYAQKAYNASAAGEIVYLDNSCFELGASLDNVLLYDYYVKLSPSIVIMPDVLGDAQSTISRTTAFINEYPECINQGMAVIQGATVKEMIACYNTFKNFKSESGESIHMIGIPFVFSWVDRDPTIQAQARIDLLRLMVSESIIDTSIPHHLLGTWQAREFAEYRDYDWVYSVDTSNPIMSAIEGVAYTSKGRLDKPKPTFDSSYNLNEGDINMDLLYYNVNMFKELVNGK